MRFRASLTVAGIIAATGLGLVGLASTAVAYPTPPSNAITLSKTVGTAGSPFYFSASGFKAGSSVTPATDGVNGAALTANSSGGVNGQTTAYTIGSHTLTLTGVNPFGIVRVLGVKFSIVGASKLPFTGAEIGGAAGLGALLLGGGGLMLMASRRRRLAVA